MLTRQAGFNIARGPPHSKLLRCSIEFSAPESSAVPTAISSAAKRDMARTYTVAGEWTAEDLRQIELLVARLTRDPILPVKVEAS